LVNANQLKCFLFASVINRHVGTRPVSICIPMRIRYTYVFDTYIFVLNVRLNAALLDEIHI